MPTDTTPDPRDMERMPEEQQIPEASREGIARKPDMGRRPPIPENPEAVVEVDDTAPRERDSGNELGQSDSELNRG